MMASGSQNLTTYLAKGFSSVFTTNALNSNNLLYINTNDTNITADMLGATTSIAVTRMSNTTGAYTTGHIVWLNVANVGTPFQLVVHDSSHLYLYKRWKSGDTWSDWIKMSAGTADVWTTARTITIGGTGKLVDGSANVSWSMNEIMGSSDSSKFYRGDKTWANKLTGNLQIEKDSDANVDVKCTDTSCSIQLDSYKDGRHGIWSNGYWDGSQFVSGASFLGYRNTSGANIWNGNANTASALVPYASIGSSTTDHGVALKNWFTANKSTAPRNQVISFYSATGGNGSQYMGYFLSGYADNPYGGFFVCHYNNPYYVGIQNGTYTQQHILTSTNYASYAVTLSTDQTITGTKTFQKRIIAHGYKQASNLPFMTFDKPGSYATGMGPDGTNNRIKFGPCDLAGTAWTAQSAFNSNQWFFQGSIYGTSTLTIESSATITGGITSQHGHIFNVAGNEFNWIPDGYNSTMWFNYESFGRTNNSTVSEYICGNGKHGHANLRAAKVYNAVWNDFAEYREGTTTEAGRVVAATTNSNIVSLTYERLQPCAHVISDTFGCSVGQSDTAQTPIGVGGRVLVYPYQPIENYHVGDCLCAAPNGTADIMTREEIIQYPDRIIGVVDEIPSYLIWKQTLTTDKEKNGGGKVETSVPVNGRIWIYVR